MPRPLVTAEAVSFEYRDRPVLENIDLTVAAGERIALVGRNGSGKSTLLRLLASELNPSAGKVRRVNGLDLAHLPQVGPDGATGGFTVREEVAERAGIGPAERRMDALTGRLTAGETDAVTAQTEAVERWVALGGDDFGSRLEPALESVGVDPGWADRKLNTLSGGQIARVRLAALRLARLDCVLLDEPTSHLDADGLRLLDGILATARFAAVFASHDRTFLAAHADRVIELERTVATGYRGGWATYLRERANERERAEREYREATAERHRLAALERRLAENARIGERRARRSGEPDKFIRHMAIASAQKNTAISGVAKRIEDVEIPEKPWKEDLSTLLLDVDRPVHSAAVIALRDVTIGRDSWTCGPLDLTISPGERILLDGPNGSGKSTLIGLLAGRIEPLAGEVTRPGSVTITELAQNRTALDGSEESLAQAFRRLSGLEETAARTTLAAMRLGPEQAGAAPAALSPGERTRAELALLAVRGASCILLDEPGNHLDLEALETLEAALDGWNGALVMASHDRAFRQRIRTDRTVTLR